MGFLSPWMLALAAAAAVPLLLHLLHRHQGPRVVFPALRYLRRAEKEHARRIRLKQILLLALRIAALLFLALAAGRPYVRTGGAGHRPTAVVLVLDNSLSSGAIVGDRRVLARLQERALQTLAAAGPDDRFWLLRAGEPWTPALSGDASAIARRVRETGVSFGAGDLAASIGRGRALLDAGADGRATELQLLSDLQATGLPAAMTTAAVSTTIVVWDPGGVPPRNAGVTELQLGGGFAPRAGERTTVAGRVQGTQDSVAVRLLIGDRGVAAAVTDTTGRFALPLTARSVGVLAGRVELDPDALRGDDRRWFAAEVRPPPIVALTQPAPFLDEALDVLAGAGRIRRGPAGSADVVLAPGALGVGAVRQAAAVVVLPPDSAVELPAANRRLANAGLPWRFGPASGGGEARFAATAEDPELAAALADARVVDFFPLRTTGPDAGDTVLLRLSTRDPWLVKGHTIGGTTYVMVASPLASEATTLPTSAALIPLLDRILGPWTTRGAAVRDIRIGESIALPPAASALARPDGRFERARGGSTIRVTAPGIYRVLSEDSTLDVIAVNPSASETPLQRLTVHELERRLGGADVHVAGDAAAWRRAIFRSRYGYELWPVLLLAALATLAAEALVAASGRAPSVEQRKPATERAS